MANCKSYQALTTKEKTEFIGQLVHIVQSDERAMKYAKEIIAYGERQGLLDDVTILPERTVMVGAGRIPESEMVLATLLLEVPKNTVWGETIRRVLASGRYSEYQLLKEELRSQALDNPEAMGRIIGRRALDLLMKNETVEA